MKYYFWILGCAMNYSDAERMATVLESLGYTKTEKENEADLFVVISCSVRESAALSIYGKVCDLREYRIKNKEFRTILTGCVLEKDRKKLGKVFDVMMTVEDLPKLKELLNYRLPITNNQQNSNLKLKNLDLIDNWKLEIGNSENDYLSITPRYESTFRAYVPISTGCDNFCTYCAVPYTKGREKSRPMEGIIAEVGNLIKNDYKEITLLGQNVNSYGNDLSTSLRGTKQSLNAEKDCHVVPPRNDEGYFAELLQELDKIPGDHRIYFYSNHPKDMSDELIKTLATLKHFPYYIHLPLQSGNDEIIRKMNRHYTKQQYLELVGKIRNVIPDVTLTTDIIVGFPGETEAQFADTADVMEKAEYDMAFIAQYSPREGTVSAKQPDDVPKAEKIRREKVLQEIVKKTVLKHNKEMIGTTQRVLVDEKKPARPTDGNGKYFGRTEGFKVVEINVIYPSNDSRYEKLRPSSSQQVSNNNKTDLVGLPRALSTGRFIDVKIESASSWKLVGTTRFERIPE